MLVLCCMRPMLPSPTPHCMPVFQCGYDVGRWRDEAGQSVVELAVAAGNVAMVRALYDVRCELGAGGVWAGRGGEQVLLAAAAHKEPDPVFVLQLLQCGVSINCQDDQQGHTPLLRACQRGNQNQRLVKTLLEHGADVQHRDHDGKSALHVACLRNHHEVVEVLLGAGAEVDAKDKHGTTPVMLAAAHAKSHVLMMLLREGADANAADSSGVTPLIAAIKNGRDINMKMLVDAGARVDVLTHPLLQALRAHPKHLQAVVYPALRSRHIRGLRLGELGSQFLVLALETGHVAIARMLIRGGVKPNVTTSDGKTPFAVAIQRKHSSLALTLLRYSAEQETTEQYDQEGTTDDHETKEDGQERTKEDGQERTKEDGQERTKEDGQERTKEDAQGRVQEFEQSIRLSVEEELRGCSLSQIVALGNEELVQERLRLSSVSVTGLDGDSAVHSAVGSEGVMRCLLAAGADANARNVDGDTPLHRVTGLDMCTLLLKHGANINATNAHAQTPLLAMLMRRFQDVGKAALFLVAQGADVLQQDDAGRSAVAQCVLNNAPSILAAMLDSLPHPPALLPEMLTELLVQALDSGRYACARVLVQRGVAQELVWERVGLHTAIQHGLASRELVAWRHGEVNEKGQQGVTPLMMACRQGQVDLVQALLEHGARVDATDDEGATALFYCTDDDTGTVVAKTVLLAGANPNHSHQKWQKGGVTPLMMACRQGQVDLVQALLEHGARVDATDDEGSTSLFYCRHADSAHIVTRLVLQAGANPNHCNYKGDYPYSRLTEIHVLQELLQAGADINRQDRSYFTPLLVHAAEYRLQDLVQFLLTNPVRKAEPNIVNHAGVSALSVACSYDAPGIVALLLEHGADCNLGPAPLPQAFNHPRIVRMLLQHKCDPNQQNSCGETLLVLAAQCKDRAHRQRILGILAGCPGVDVEARDEHGRSVLHLALAHKSYLSSLLPFLINRHARFDTTDACHRGILHDWQPGTDSLAQLALGEVLRQRVDVNQQDYNGHTPMHLAVLEPDVRLRRIKCRKLLSFGADLSIGDKNGLTVYHLATHDPQLFHSLMQHAPCEFPAASRDLLLALSRHFQTEASITAVLQDIHCPPVAQPSEKISNVTFTGAYGLAEWSADMMADIASKGHHNFFSQMLHNGVLCSYPHDQMAEMQEKAETVLALFQDISAEVAKYDAMLAFTPFIAGSCNEGTKVTAPDEMDMLCVLHCFTGLRFFEQQKFPCLVKIYQDNPYPPFTGPELNLMIHSQVFRHFYHAFGRALQNSALWEKYPRLYRLRMDDMSDSNQAISEIALVWHGHHFPFLEFSVDVVPAFRGGAWLPEGARDHPLLRRNGILVIPKFRIEYITKTDVTELFQVSFERSEADLFHMMPVELKQAYMLAKIVKTKIPKIELLPAGMFVSSYLLKTCAFSLFHDHPEYQQRLGAFLATDGASAAFTTPPYDPHPLAPAADVIYWCKQLFLRLHQAMGTRSLPAFFLPAYNLLSHRVYVENYRPQLMARIGRTLLLDPEAEAEAWRGLAEEQPWSIGEVDPNALLMDVPAPCTCTRFCCTKKHVVKK
jgi:ankyrin repeat protein